MKVVLHGLYGGVEGAIVWAVSRLWPRARRRLDKDILFVYSNIRQGYPMPLYIKDPRIAEMAERLRALTNASSKTEAVWKALERAIEEAQRELRPATRGGGRYRPADWPP